MKFLLFLLFLTTSILSAKEIPLEKMISQMILVGFSGETPNDKWVLQIQNDIQNEKIGGVILFGRNIKNPTQLKELNNFLIKSNKSKLPLFIAIDQEGGKVQRLNKNNGFSDYLSALEIANTKTISESLNEYDKLSKELYNYGFNLNFAPVVDLNLNEDAPIIGAKQRSYSRYEEIVISYANTFIDSMHKYKIFNAIKHFPGHGSANSDSHLGFTDISQTWQYEELKPYFHFIKSGKVDMVMVGHLSLDKFDKHYPATLSKNTIEFVLRQKMGYDGVVVSDDMLMRAIAEHYTFEKSIVKSIQAGVDILLFSSYFYNNSNVPKVVHSVINEAIKKGEITTQMIERSYNRVVKLKSKLLEK